MLLPDSPGNPLCCPLAYSAEDSQGRKNSEPGGSRTPNRCIRSAVLYPIKLQVLVGANIYVCCE